MVLHQAKKLNRDYRYTFDFSSIVVTNNFMWFAVTTNYTKEVEKHLSEINYLGI